MNSKKQKLLRILGLPQEEEVSIMLKEVNDQLNSFNKIISITPVLTVVSNLEKIFNQKTRELESKISELSNFPSQIDSVNSAISELRDEKNEDLTLLQQELDNSKEIEDRLSEIITQLNESLDKQKSASKEEMDTEKALIRKELEKLRLDINTRFSNIGGGAMNRKITFNGTDYLTRYTDINYKAGTNVTFTIAQNNTTKMVDVTVASSGGGGGGTVRSINSISADTNAGSTSGTDYVYLCSGTVTLTLPDATANTNLYTIKNVGVGIVTIATTSSQTIDGTTTITMPVQYTSVDLISDTANWNVT